MIKFCGTLLILLVVLGLNAQEPALPGDFRQQNLTEYNSSLLNPAYALERNNPTSIAFWSRWQWQVFDFDPTTIFLNYTQKLNEQSAAGLGFFQNNTGIFLNTGIDLNYAYLIPLSEKVQLGVGINVFVFRQKLADERFFVPNPIQTAPENDLVVQMAPGINVKVDAFSLGFVSENLWDFNITNGSRNTSPSERMFFGLASYDFPISIISDGEDTFRPALYFKSIPGYDTQLGFSGLLTTNKFWAQGGYNSFYGISAGVGGRFFDRFSIGALVEFGTSKVLDGKDPSFEVVTAYKIGKLKAEEELEKQEELIAEEILEQPTKAEKLAQKQQAREDKRLARENAIFIKDSLEQVEKSKKLALIESRRIKEQKADSVAQAQTQIALMEANALREKQQKDSLQAILMAKEKALAWEQQRKQDSLAALAKQKKEVVTPEAGERYEEVSKEGELEPGYYLIANVFGTKKYFDAFMAEMTKRGLQPKSFFRAKNNYNYVYLGYYTSIEEARKARDSNLNGKYPEKTWVFRVVGE